MVELSKQNKKNLNCSNFKELIKLVLTTLDNELNTKRHDMDININEYDQTFTFNKFKEAINRQNDSMVYKLFFGDKKITLSYQKCKIESYSYKFFKCKNCSKKRKILLNEKKYIHFQRY